MSLFKVEKSVVQNLLEILLSRRNLAEKRETLLTFIKK
jgi:hypothetical protein